MSSVLPFFFDIINFTLNFIDSRIFFFSRFILWRLLLDKCWCQNVSRILPNLFPAEVCTAIRMNGANFYIVKFTRVQWQVDKQHTLQEHIICKFIKCIKICITTYKSKHISLNWKYTFKGARKEEVQKHSSPRLCIGPFVLVIVTLKFYSNNFVFVSMSIINILVFSSSFYPESVKPISFSRCKWKMYPNEAEPCNNVADSFILKYS